MRYLTLAAICVALAGCSTPVVMRNAMGMTAECGPYPSLGINGIVGAERERQCIQDYQRQGYERIPSR